jgi:anti-sigma factor RsiW
MSALTCKQLAMLITEYEEGALPESERARFDAHLASCGNCAEYLNQMRTTLRLVGRLREDDIDQPARDALLAAFHDWHARSAS